MSISIKPLSKSDAAAAAEILYNTWQNHFALYMPNENIEPMTREACQQGWEKILAKGDDRILILGAFVGEELAGTLLLGPAREKDCFETELWSMLISSRHRRLGLGAKLFNESQKWLKEAGISHFYLNCIDLNESARRFYDKLGGECLPLVRVRKGYNEVVYAFSTVPVAQIY